MVDQEQPLGRYAAVFHELVEGRTEPGDWLVWWEQHEQQVKALCSPGVFLRLKPRGVGDDPARRVLVSQQGACEVLDLLGVGYVRSDRYELAWQRAFEQFCREERAKEAAKAAEFAPAIARLAGHFPRFARFLKANIDDVDSCRSGLDDAELARLEQDLGLRLPAAYRTFLQCTREVVLGDTLQITSTHPFVHDSTKVALPTQGMLCIADFWLTGDGDQALFDLRDGVVDDPPVLYYDHDQPAVRPIAASFTAWIEKLPQTLAE